MWSMLSDEKQKAVALLSNGFDRTSATNNNNDAR